MTSEGRAVERKKMSEGNYKTYPIVLNRDNLTNTVTNATFSFRFPGTVSTFKNAEVAISQINMYNSIFNINQQVYNNNSFSIIFPVSSGGVDSTYTLNISLPNSYMDYDAINAYVQQQMITEGLYLIKGGSNFYFWNIQSNPTLYSSQINEFSVPLVSTYAAAGYTLPATGKWSGVGSSLPVTNAYTPQTTITNNNFKLILGLNAGTYPPVQQATTYSVSSTYTPTINPVQSLNVHCSLTNSPLTIPPDYIGNFNPNNVEFGSLFSYQPSTYEWISIPDQTVGQITVYFTDQSNNAVYINDPTTTIALFIRWKE